MIKDDTRQTIKVVAWLVAALVLLYFATLVIFYRASRPERSQTQEINRVARQKTPITTITKNYHLDRGVNSYALMGVGKNKQKYYFVYLPGSKRAYLLPAQKGLSEAAIRAKFTAKTPGEKITKVNLGWYRGRAVWETTSKNYAGSYHYRLYDFKNGNLIG
ncbi:hypothetical protein [Lactobacillus xylocopicola]|uniref:DUF5590 domain-containing protein n=1 Tax=Lactobacillus xylocopicola TaxID=2976676 RepID=A0ABN6SLN5_9LACO|nr:hypothetical protein [Lactobacillus xylocopicola]BDR60509.1 hypothetical protein KIM322_07700 [Lactobacillus xylocopicola]